MKNRPLILGSQTRNRTLPSLITAITAGFALSFGTATAQSQSGDDGQYSVVVWDPSTGSWVYAEVEEVGQQARNQSASDRQSTSGQSRTIQNNRERQSTEYGAGETGTTQGSTTQSERERQTTEANRSENMQNRSQTERRGAGYYPEQSESMQRADRQREGQSTQYRTTDQTTNSERDSERERTQPSGQQQRSQEWRDTRSANQRNDQQRSEHQSQTVQGSGSVNLEGTVQGFREVNLRRGQAAPEEHTWVRIQMEGGFDTIVDLGREKDLSDLELERGDKIRVSGKHGTIGTQNVLIADRIRVGNETVNIDRKESSKQQVSGKVRSVSEVNLDSDELEDQLVVRLQMEGGEEVVAALGENTTLRELELEEDTRVRLQGERTMVDGRPILKAKRISVDGDTTNVRQEEQRSQSQDRN